MVMKVTALCLVGLALLGSLCNAGPGKPSFDPQQEKQTFEKPIDWKYPSAPKEEPKPEVNFEMRYPVAAATVAVECRERDARVEVKKDMFGTGQLINPSDLTLGDCSVVAEDNIAHVLIFEAELHECGSQLVMLDDSVIYTFILNYFPKPLGGSEVVRTNQAAVIVECHYPRKHNVSSLALDPLWIPFSSVKVAEEFLYFTMALMTYDWLYERPSYQYFLGDTINIEATVKQYYHVPLRVFFDSCVASLSPDPSLRPRYAFIEDGCLVDALVTGSESRFMTRTIENKLQLQLEAFRFQDAESGYLYITCNLKAASTSYGIDSEHRACYYASGWKEANGYDSACNNCGTGLSTSGSGVVGTGGPAWTPGGSTGSQGKDRKIRNVSKKEVVIWEGTVAIGPLEVKNKPRA